MRGGKEDDWMNGKPEKHRTEKLFDEIKIRIVESGCSMKEAIEVLKCMEIACRNAELSTKKPPHQ